MSSGFNKYDLWAIARPRLLVVAIVSFVGLIGTYGATYLMSPVYRVEVTLLPVEQNSDSSRLLGLGGAFGDLASLAGVSSGSNIKVEAFETLKSRAFVKDFPNTDDGLLASSIIVLGQALEM